MTRLFALVAGAALVILGHLLAAAMGGIDTLNGTIVAIGYFALAVGVWVFKDDPGMGRIGRVGIVLTAFGTAAFGTVALLAMNAGVRSQAEIALTPFYLMAVLFMALGLAAFALHHARAATAPQGLWSVFAVLAVLQVLRPFLAGWDFLHALAAAGTALIFGALAIMRWRLQR